MKFQRGKISWNWRTLRKWIDFPEKNIYNVKFLHILQISSFSRKIHVNAMLFHSCLKLQNAFSRNKCPRFKSGAKFEIKGETFSRKFFVNIFQLMPMKIKSTRKTCYPHTGYIFQYTKLPYGNVRRIVAQIQDAIAIWVNLDG